MKAKPPFNPRAQAAILQGVRDQIQSPESPYVKEHYERLRKKGIPEEEVMKMLGAVLAVELWELNKHNRSFNESEYIKTLERLPDLSWLDEG